MPAEGTDTLGAPPADIGGVLPELAAVSVADGDEVEPLLRRATADLSSLRLRRAAAIRRAERAEASIAEVPATEGSAETGAGDEPEAEHRSRRAEELLLAQTAADEAVAAARADADALLRAANLELEVATLTAGAADEAPPAVEPDAESHRGAGRPGVEPVPAVTVAPVPSLAERLLDRDVVALVLVGFILILLLSLG